MGMGAAAAAALAEAVATTDNCFSRRVEWHAGQAGCDPLRTSVSKWWAHDWQAYSYMGMGELLNGSRHITWRRPGLWRIVCERRVREMQASSRGRHC
jgi:hypothetical protein